MKHLFVSYELALLAKEKGFNEPCLACFSDLHNAPNSILLTGNYPYFFYKNDMCSLSAPLYQQLVDWFREDHKIEVVVLSNTHTCSKDVKWEWSLYSLTNKKIIKYPVLNVPSYYQAITASLTEAFKLINP